MKATTIQFITDKMTALILDLKESETGSNNASQRAEFSTHFGTVFVSKHNINNTWTHVTQMMDIARCTHCYYNAHTFCKT